MATFLTFLTDGYSRWSLGSSDAADAWVLVFSLRLFKRLQDNQLHRITLWSGVGPIKIICENMRIFSKYRTLCWSSCRKITFIANVRLQIYKEQWAEMEHMPALPHAVPSLPLLCINCSSCRAYPELTNPAENYPEGCFYSFSRLLTCSILYKIIMSTGAGTKKVTDWRMEEIV